ncbi:MAG: thioesterase [Lachnospiraceae bacterium]|nr:thioesterase [Lachnospiraceae bacterium]
MRKFWQRKKYSMEEGIKGRAESIVTPDKTAISMKSGNLPVYATPAVVALMEQASYESVAPYLEDGEATVGVSMEVKHIAATHENRKVWAESTLTAVDGRRLLFEVIAYDEDKCIAKGSHERVVINIEKFMGK